jgi:hypothetical protein
MVSNIYTSNVRDVLVLAGVTSAMTKRNHCLAKNICHRHGQTPTNSIQPMGSATIPRDIVAIVLLWHTVLVAI